MKDNIQSATTDGTSKDVDVQVFKQMGEMVNLMRDHLTINRFVL